ncbi:M48 family metallopeptidase [Yinghuangia seranimata]|uniref:M48 family metallopeptidase n=1 Tax=Yinghuangia seranimata TaxID=408067 RepID=UPI00248BA2A5|nr:M48 family metalloprotease [Yinghuangia seranimata]MDI2125023.1 M48 family metalloprotease [Yinghuangia seranimata]
MTPADQPLAATPSNAASAAPKKPALDELILFPGTMQRFILLLVLFLAVSSGAAHDVIEHLPVAWGGRYGAVLLPYLATCALAVAALKLYRELPGWKVRRARLVPVSDIADGGRLRAELDRLSDRARLETEPTWVYAPGAPSASAVVFGTHRHPIVCLNAGLIAYATLRPARFRAVVLHELAHIHNQDVGVTYATVAMWRVLVAAVLIPKAAFVLIRGLTGVAGVLDPRGFVQDVLIVALVYLTRADILRTREIYADRTAVHLWHVDPTDLIPAARQPRPDGSSFTRLRASAVEAWRTHPSWGLRGRALAGSDMLFVQRAFPLFLTGVAADVAASRLTSPFSSVGEWPASARDAEFWQFGSPWAWLGMGQYLLVAGLAAGIGGVVLWRAVLRAVLTGRRTPTGWSAGLWLGAGLALGELSNSSRSEGQSVPAHPEVLLVLVAVVALLMSWTAQYADLRIRTYRGTHLRTAMTVGVLVPGVVLAFVMLWWVKEGWITGWHSSVSEALTAAELPVSDASLPLRTAATLTALPGSDMSFSGLWWTVPLLWLVPLQLWLARLPRAPSKRGGLRRGRRTGRRVRRNARREARSPGWSDHPPRIPSGKASTMHKAATATLRALRELWTCLTALLGFGALLLGAMFFGFFLIYGGLLGNYALGLSLWLAFMIVRRRLDEGDKGYWLERARPGAAPPPAPSIQELRRFVRVGVVGGLVGCAGLLAEPLVTRSAHGETTWQVQSIESLVWTIVVTVAVMLAVAVVAGCAAQGGYPVLTALIASGVACVISLTGQGVRGSLDGCLGPLNNLAPTCDWQPERYAPLVEHALGYAMTLGLLAAAAAAALSHAAATVFRPRRRAVVSAGATAAAGQLAGPRPAMGFVNTIAVALIVGSTSFQTLVQESPLPRNDLLIAYQIPPTGPLPNGVSPLADWMRHVGDTMARYAAAIRMAADAFDAYRAAPQDADVATLAKGFEPACAELTDIVENADQDGRVISPSLPKDLRQAWTRYLAEVKNVRERCLAARDATTGTELVSAVEGLVAAGKNQMPAAKELAALIGS